MHRESDDHGPARNDYLRKQSLMRSGGATRADEDRPGGRAASPERPAARRCMSPADVARRAELTRHLPPAEFPADRSGLLAHLRARRAPDSVIDAISRLPEGREFHTIGEIVRALGPRAGHG